MPTRIVIPANPSSSLHHDGLPHIGRIGAKRPVGTEFRSPSPHRARARRQTKTPISGVVGFRSSVRESPSTRSIIGHHGGDDLHLSRNDLRASPRLQGYLFMLVASTVMLVSVMKFYNEREMVKVVRHLEEEEGFDGTSVFTHTFGSRVLTWKLNGAIIVAAAGVGISLFVLLVHFDSVCFPRLWKAMFRDGSKGELCLLLFLLLFWMGGLHICTSAFSVGELAPNVYFTAWITFAFAAMNVGVWRTSADLPTLTQKLREHPRETFHSWFAVFVFSMVTCLSIVEMYANRDEVMILIDGEVQYVPQKEWNKGMGSSIAAVGVSLLNLLCTNFITKPLRFKVWRGIALNLDWRQVEGLLALLLVGLFAWFIYEYTGVNSALSSPSNPYFGSWGVLFCSGFTFGTWLKENSNIEFFITD